MNYLDFLNKKVYNMKKKRSKQSNITNFFMTLTILKLKAKTLI